MSPEQLQYQSTLERPETKVELDPMELAEAQLDVGREAVDDIVELDTVADNFHQAYEPLPLAHEAAYHLSEQVNALDVSGRVEYVENGSFEQALDKAKKRAEIMSEGGIERSEFGGVETMMAIESYYGDHEVALTTLKAIANGETITPNANLGITNELMNEGIKRLAEEGDNRQLFREMTDLLYREPCVGQLTLDAPTIDRIAREKVNLLQSLGMSNSNYENAVAAEKQLIEIAQQETRNEVRNAGQLLFHNSVYGKEIRWNGSLRGRAQQEATQENVRITTASTEGHSTIPHFSEVYDPVGYKRDHNQNARNVEQGAQAMTVAVPIAEVIKQAPYSRGLEYATVRAKDMNADLAVVTENYGKVTGAIGAGGMDGVGYNQLSLDRTFAAAPDKVAGERYDIPLSGKDTMRYNDVTRQDESVVYEIQSRSDQVYNLHEEAKRADGAKLTQIRQDLSDFGQAYALREHGNGIDSAGSGMGYGMPKKVIIEDREVAGTEVPERAQREPTADMSEADIRAIEAASIRRFKGEYVVPLRAVATEFMLSGDSQTGNPYGVNLARMLQNQPVYE